MSGRTTAPIYINPRLFNTDMPYAPHNLLKNTPISLEGSVQKALLDLS